MPSWRVRSKLQESCVWLRVDWHVVSVQVDDLGPILDGSCLHLKNKIGASYRHTVTLNVC